MGFEDTMSWGAINFDLLFIIQKLFIDKCLQISRHLWNWWSDLVDESPVFSSKIEAISVLLALIIFGIKNLRWHRISWKWSLCFKKKVRLEKEATTLLLENFAGRLKKMRFCNFEEWNFALDEATWSSWELRKI